MRIRKEQNMNESYWADEVQKLENKISEMEDERVSVVSIDLLGFLDAITDARWSVRPKRIVLPPEHHGEYKEWYRTFINSVANPNGSTYSCAVIELSNSAKSLSVSY